MTRYVVITGASLPSPKNKTVCLCAVMIPPDFFHGSAAFTKSINQITCCTFNMLPTWLSPLTVGNQYIVSLAAAFPTICCPCPFYFVIGQCEKRHHSGDAADGMMFIQGRKIGRYWLPAGRRAGQRAASVAGFKNAGGNLKLSRTPREILQISLNMLRSDPNRAFTITCNSRPAA